MDDISQREEWASLQARLADAERDLDRALEKLRQVEMRFGGAFAAAAHGMALVSLDGRFLEVNKALCALVGYSEQELLATTFQAITYPSDVKADLANAERLVAGEIESYQMDKRYIRKDGKLLWIRLAVSVVRAPDRRPLYFVAQIHDLSAEKLLEEVKRRHDDQFRRLVQGVSDFAIYTLNPDGRIMSWNAGATRIKRYPALEVVGRSFEIFFTEEDRNEGEPRRILDAAVRDGKFETIGVRMRGDGTPFTAHVVLDAIRGSKGELLGFTKITRDVSEIRDSDLSGQSAVFH